MPEPDRGGKPKPSSFQTEAIVILVAALLIAISPKHRVMLVLLPPLLLLAWLFPSGTNTLDSAVRVLQVVGLAVVVGWALWQHLLR